MLSGLLLLALAAPFTPVVEDPHDEAWTVGLGAGFSTDPYEDDAGLEAASVRLEFRRDDAGYGAYEETKPYERGVTTTLLLPEEGARWCFRITHINVRAESSPPSLERCFRTDWTRPTRPAFVDAGAIVSTGEVFVEMQPATDALSGVQAYFLTLAPTDAGEVYWYPDPEQQLPLVSYVGEGAWFGWVHVVDRAYNDNWDDFGDYLIPITVTASSTVLTPGAPTFEQTMNNQYGSPLLWDAGWMGGPPVTHVVASYCNLDAGCEWHHGFHSVPAADEPRRWLQVADEGTIVARIAVVQGGQVGPWSAPSAPLLIDRTAPPRPPGLAATPSATRMGPVLVSWNPVIDNLTGLAVTVLEETELLSGTQRRLEAMAPAVSFSVTPSGDGRFQYRASSVDRVGNESDWSAPVVVIVDGHGPGSQPPVARAIATDGGALVSLTWPFPADALSAIASQELLEESLDAGQQTVTVTGLSASRLVVPGTWRWSLRATDSLGNVGAFSSPSNLIIVTATGVSVGPSIVTTTLAARCGEPLAADLVGSGDAPLSWSLVSGPAGLGVDGSGRLTWTPAASNSTAVVRLTNTVGSVEGTIDLPVTCEATDGGSTTSPKPMRLLVGCGCSSLEASMSVMALLALLRKRR